MSDDTPPPGHRPALAADDPAEASRAPRTVLVNGVRLGRGSRVRLRPAGRSDIFDLALDGLAAEIDGVEEDLEGRVHVAVTLDGDAGRDFTTGLGHRFFFSPEELTPDGDAAESLAAPPRILVAGVGDAFRADDAFGPEVVAALHRRPLPKEVHVADFGIRRADLAHRLTDGYDVAILVAAAPGAGREPSGAVHVVEPDVRREPPAREATASHDPACHSYDPVGVLDLAVRLRGRPLPRVLVVGCGPAARTAAGAGAGGAATAPGASPGPGASGLDAVGWAVDLLRKLTTSLLRDHRAPLEEILKEEVNSP